MGGWVAPAASARVGGGPVPPSAGPFAAAAAERSSQGGALCAQHLQFFFFEEPIHDAETALGKAASQRAPCEAVAVTGALHAAPSAEGANAPKVMYMYNLSMKGRRIVRIDYRSNRFIVYFVQLLERHISYAARYLHTAHPGQGMGAQGRLEPPHPLNTTRTSVEHVLHPGSPCKPPWRSAGRERGNLHPFALSHEHRQERSCTGSHPQATSECISEA